jgi:hypothetical protein
LYPCVSSATNRCKSAGEVDAFFKQSPKMQFMYMDNYLNVEDYKILVHQFLNEEKFVTIDLIAT